MYLPLRSGSLLQFIKCLYERSSVSLVWFCRRSDAPLVDQNRILGKCSSLWITLLLKEKRGGDRETIPNLILILYFLYTTKYSLKCLCSFCVHVFEFFPDGCFPNRLGVRCLALQKLKDYWLHVWVYNNFIYGHIINLVFIFYFLFSAEKPSASTDGGTLGSDQQPSVCWWSSSRSKLIAAKNTVKCTKSSSPFQHHIHAFY